MSYITNMTQQKALEAQGWAILHDLLTRANLTKEQWSSVNLALGFPVMAEQEKKENEG